MAGELAGEMAGEMAGKLVSSCASSWKVSAVSLSLSDIARSSAALSYMSREKAGTWTVRSLPCLCMRARY